MKKIIRVLPCAPARLIKASMLLLGTLACLPVSAADSSDCSPRARDHFVCGIPSAEDLVHLPGTPWLIASNFASDALLNVINTDGKTWQTLAPSAAYSEQHDTQRFPDCPGPIAEQAIVTHGLHLANNGEKSTLYAVGHGAREAIEVFDINSNGDQPPVVRWVGCVPTPSAQAANSVVSLANGDLLATIPLEAGFEFTQSMNGVATGAVYRWTAATGQWQRFNVTAQPYPNGISVSVDETRFYVVSSGLRHVVAYSISDSPRKLGVSEALAIIPDNLHRDPGGALITAGMLAQYTPCSPYNEAGEFELDAFGSCPRPYQVIAVDPDTLIATRRIDGAVNPAFSNVTMSVVVGDTVWMGSFGADRVAYRPGVSIASGEYFSLRPAVEKAYGYTHAVKQGNSIKISGAVSMDDEGNPTAVGDLAQQMRNVYGDLERVLSHYGLGFEHVTVENIFTTDMAGFLAVSGAYRDTLYKGRFPTGSWLEVMGLALPEFMLEIELEAHSPE